MSVSLSTAVHMLDALPSQDLDALMVQIQQVKEERREKIVQLYGIVFSKIVGINTLLNLPVVEANELALDGDRNYYQDKAKPDQLGGRSAFRGITRGNSPFVAIKIEILDKVTRVANGIVLDVIRMENNLFREPMEPNYEVERFNAAEDETHFGSYQYLSHGVVDELGMKGVRDLLDGKEIDSRCRTQRIRMVRA